ncbi:6-phosphogluconate dehydrogenase [Actinomadura sp. NBRC 104425]|uniref:NAD(P)-dependent oxidoreductase n=1 Tax=Actinomadura sp. NBRC 104425 TaxID=3032204 RepID=UPI0024A40C17|nr:NAD(P)-binding domain-containing protein [Actinomadura sp. NBRC 104425]GLZ10775.1 6-phosphogluconate dehydrogenase [Actinomadura sp. NBRC 104425]
MPSKPSVALLGLGAMGTALADALLAAGHRLTVWNRTPARADALVERGAVRAGTPAEAFASADVSIICILDYADVHTLVDEAGQALRGRTLVNLTNGAPAEARTLAEKVSALGAEYLDGGIMAVPEMIAQPVATLLYSGSAAAFEKHREVLDVFGRSVYLGDDPGTAPLHDLALLSGMYGMIGGFLHAAALVRASGGEVAEFARDELVPWLRAMLGAVPAWAAQVDARDYAETGSNLAMQVSHDAIGDLSRAQGVSTELWDPILQLMKRRVADGHGAEGLPGLVELLVKD